ncbi:hypothetical protein ABZX82_01720 [Streptomyces griseoflavus]|uniref:hypothetical protein n=1 Tax=Streptomyces griseoflavus TaxID=35619 RepID=UPI0033A78008
MIGEVTEYMMIGKGELHRIPDAVKVAPGLYVFRLPDAYRTDNPRRFRIGHHSGNSIADAMRREDAIRGAEIIAPLHDWRQDTNTIRAAFDRRAEHELYVKIGAADCIVPNSERCFHDVSNNGRYTDMDVEQAAIAAKEEGLSAFEVLYQMSHTVPWKGLDTNDFNEAHDRIVAAAGAE